jgi:hypothetical protein
MTIAEDSKNDSDHECNRVPPKTGWMALPIQVNLNRVTVVTASVVVFQAKERLHLS